MIKLYRGLIDILIFNSRTMDEMFTKHIREGCQSDDNNDFGVKGFWNFLLEVIMVIFVKVFIAFGVLLTVSLAVIFFPLYAIKTSVMNVMDHRATPFQPEFVEPTVEKKNG